MTAREVELPPLNERLAYDAAEVREFARAHAIAVAAAARREMAEQIAVYVGNSIGAWEDMPIGEIMAEIRALSAQHGESGGAL